MNEGPATLDAVHNGQPFGDVAGVILASGMDINRLRTNTTLRQDEWKSLDQTVVQIARQRLVAVNDLVSRGLVHPVDGMAATMLEWDDISDMTAANLDMVAATRGQADRVVFKRKQIPLPFAHKGFDLDIRTLNMSRKLGQALDDTQVAVCTRKVSDLVEDLLVNGTGAYAFGGGTIHGYTTHPSRNTVTLAENWDAAGKTPEEILADVLGMVQAAANKNHHGPFVLYTPKGYEKALDDDYVAGSAGMAAPTQTVRQRLAQIEKIEAVKTLDQLAANNVILVEMAPETARMVDALQPRVVQWSSEGGFVLHFKVIAIQIPQIRADQDGNSGVVHLS